MLEEKQWKQALVNGSRNLVEMRRECEAQNGWFGFTRLSVSERHRQSGCNSRHLRSGMEISMSCVWVSMEDCSQSQWKEWKKMLEEDRDLQIILCHEQPVTHQYGKESGCDVGSLLTEMGIKAHLKGYRYLKESLLICMEDREELEGITKRLYPDVAKKCSTSSDKVEHAIRHAIESAWKNGNREAQRSVFGYQRESARRPTNLEFISGLAEYLERGA